MDKLHPASPCAIISKLHSNHVITYTYRITTHLLDEVWEGPGPSVVSIPTDWEDGGVHSFWKIRFLGLFLYFALYHSHACTYTKLA